MKKLLIVGIASVLCVSLAQAGGITELRTEVKNNTKGDIWVTWKSATTGGKIISGVAHVAKNYRYLLIPAGKKYTMAHTGDRIHVYAYPCAGTYTKYKATLKGYQRMDVVGNTITESVDANKPGVTTGGTKAATSELRTHVYNNNANNDIWVTWKSATTQGKIFTTPFHWMREHRFVRIQGGKSYAMMHTGDKLSVYTYGTSKVSCNAQEAEYTAQFKGYKHIDVGMQSGKLNISESK
ncbi:MAG: hypothetical protein ACHQVS_04070 [Candidatus Babeliales bacterium]